MCAAPTLSPLTARLAADLCLALMGQGVFATGRPEARQALGALHDGLAKRLRDAAQVTLLTGPPSAPLNILGWGFCPTRERLEELLPVEMPAALLQHLAGFCRDRRLYYLHRLLQFLQANQSTLP